MGKKESNVVLKFTTDGEVQFGKTVKALDAEMNNAAKTYRQNIAVMGQNSSKTAQLTAEKKKLENQMKLGRERTKLLGEEYDRLATSQGKNSEAAIKAKGKVIESENAELALEKSLQKVNKELKQQGNLSIETAEKLEKISKTGDKMQSVGKKMTKGITAPILAIGAASLASFKKLDENLDSITTATGATGKQLESLHGSFKNVVEKIPDDMGNISSAIGEVNTQFGFMDTELENTSEKMLQFSRITGSEVSQSTINAKKSVDLFRLSSKDIPMILDSIAKTSQDTGVGVDQLFDAVNKGAPQLKAMGLGFSESTTLIGQMEKAGIDSAGTLGYLAKASVVYAKDNKTMQDGLSGTIESIKGATTEQEKLTIASEVFGTKAATKMVEAIDSGALSMDGLADSTKNALGTVDKTYNNVLSPMEKAKLAQNNLTVALGELGNEIQIALAPAFEKVINVLKGVTGWFRSLSDEQKQMIVKIAGMVAVIGPALIIFGKVASSVMKIYKAISVLKAGLSAFMSFLKIVTLGFNPWVLAIAAVIAIFVLLYTKCEWFRDGVHAILKFIGDLFVGTWNVIQEGIKAFVDYNIQVFRFWEGVTSGIFEAFLQNVSNIFGGVQRIFSGIIDFVAGVFTGDWSRAWQGVIDIFGGIFDTLVALAKAPLNMVIGLVNGAIKGLNNIKVPNWVPGLGGKGISIPTIPLLATGGHVLEGQAIVGEAGPELLSVNNGKTTVTPLSEDEKRQGISGKYKGNITVEQHNHFGKVNTNSPSELLDLDRQIARTNKQSLAGVGVIA